MFYSKIKVTYHILPLNPPGIFVYVCVWGRDPVLCLFSIWLTKCPRPISDFQCFHCHISNLLCIKHMVLYVDSIWYHWWELCLSHRLFVYKAKYIILCRCALFSEKKKFRLIYGKKNHHFNFKPLLFCCLCVGYKDSVFPVSEIHDDTLYLCWRRKDIQVWDIYSRQEKWI